MQRTVRITIGREKTGQFKWKTKLFGTWMNRAKQQASSKVNRIKNKKGEFIWDETEMRGWWNLHGNCSNMSKSKNKINAINVIS